MPEQISSNKISPSKGFVIAGTNSGCGKTTISLALMAWLSRNGFTVSPFKVGPDFIDPGHHTQIAGTHCRNLDGWMMDQAYNQKTFETHTRGSHVSIIEGVMGLFDGFSGKDSSGSTAQMAKWLDLPIILVVNAQSMARSAAALVQGFENFDPDLKFAGVIFNKLGSDSHLTYLTDALEGSVNMPCLGGILRDDRVEIPERHLGLVTRDEHLLSASSINHLADLIDHRIDTQALFGSPNPTAARERDLEPHEAKVKLGIARDKAFCFYYQDNLDFLKKQGADLVYFSPVSDTRLPSDIHGIYFGGGYPEVFAKKLSANVSMREDIKQKSMSGMPIYGECGGFMYLCNSLTDHDGQCHQMSGCFPFDTKMLKKSILGYREIRFAADTIIGKKGMTARGHEFHYSKIMSESNESIERGCRKVYSIHPRAGLKTLTEGYLTQNTLGSYIHLHFGSSPAVARHFIDMALKYKNDH